MLNTFVKQVEMSSKQLGLGPGAVGHMRARDGDADNGNRDNI